MAVLFFGFGAADYFSQNPDSMYILILPFGVLFLLFRVLLEFRKNPYRYPKMIAVEPDGIRIDDRYFPYSDIQEIFYTPAAAEGVYRTLTLKLDHGPVYRQLLGIQMDQSRPEAEKFTGYQEFIDALRCGIGKDTGKLIEDTTLSHTQEKI